MAATSKNTSVPQWLAVQLVAVLVPSSIALVAFLARVPLHSWRESFHQALWIAAPLYLPCSVYLSVWGDLILEERSPGVYRLLLGFVLFVFILVTMAFGTALISSVVIPEALFQWTVFQCAVGLAVLLHGTFEKSVLMEHLHSGSEADDRPRVKKTSVFEG